jgi:serine protease Do
MPKAKVWWIAVLFVIAVTMPCLAAPLPTGNFDRDQAISTFFKEKPANIIEGIWVTDNDEYEITIVKNDFSVCKNYDYVGFVSATNNPAWKLGEIKLQLKATAIPKLFTGSWHERNGKSQHAPKKQTIGATFRMPTDDVIQYYAGKGSIKAFYRIYPNSNMPNSQDSGSGTGFFITNNLIITNYHVIDKAKSIEVVYKNDQKIAATVIAKDPANDLAVLKIKDIETPVSPLILSSTQAKNGDTVYTVGFPMPGVLGSQAKLSEGIINSVTGFKDDVRMYQTSIPIQPGNSGSPLINSKGQVIGVITASINAMRALMDTGAVPQNVNFAIKINYVNNLIGSLPDDIHLPAAQSFEDLTPGQIMNLAKDSVVEVNVK